MFQGGFPLRLHPVTFSKCDVLKQTLKRVTFFFFKVVIFVNQNVTTKLDYNSDYVLLV